jgi:hypothetical protein
MTTRKLALLAIFTLGCAQSSRNDPGQEPLNTSVAQPLILTQTTVLPGTTSVDPTTPNILFLSHNIDQRDAIVALLTRNASFLSDDGETIGASVALRSVKMPPDGILVSVGPSGAFKADHWYTLVVTQDADLQVSNGKSLEELAARSAGLWRSDFFTGSAPHIIRAQVPRGAKDGSYVHIVFSEPVKLASLDVSRLITVDGHPMGKCLLYGGACAPSMGDAMAEEIDVAPNGPLGLFKKISFAVGGSVLGSGRPVSEGVRLSMKRAGASMDARGLARIELSAPDWQSCGEGGSSCWHAHN